MKNIVPENLMRFKSARSGGPGGQNVNKRSTKVQAWVIVSRIPVSEMEQKLIREKLAHRINHKDELEVECDEERSHEANKEKAIERMNELILEAIKIPKKRIPTTSPKGIEEKFQDEKKQHSEKKRLRKILHHTIVEEEEV